MRRVDSTLLCLAVVALCAPASAKDMSGKFGVGFDQTLGGVTGLNLRYFIGDFCIRGVIGVDFFRPSGGDSSVGVDFALGAMYNFGRTDVVNVGVGVVVDLGWRNQAAMSQTRLRCEHEIVNGKDTGAQICTQEQVGGSGSSIQFNVEVPIVVEYFFSDHFSIHLGTGLVFVIVP